MRSIVALAVLTTLAACDAEERPPSAASGGIASSGGVSAGGSSGGGATLTAEQCSKMDIVFVVDNSLSMADAQKNLAANFPKFADVITNYKTQSGDLLDYRIAVTSSDDGADMGRYHAGAGGGSMVGCDPGPARPWLERKDGDVASMFACRAPLGIGGSDIERPLENMLLSVTTGAASNASGHDAFLRNDALLAFVLITDEDEGSAGDPGILARPMADYPGAFDRVKGNHRERWAAAVIAGEQLCGSPFGGADEAVRLKGFIKDVGKNGVFSSICTGDLTQGLTDALGTFDAACKTFSAGPPR